MSLSFGLQSSESSVFVANTSHLLFLVYSFYARFMSLSYFVPHRRCLDFQVQAEKVWERSFIFFYCYWFQFHQRLPWIMKKNKALVLLGFFSSILSHLLIMNYNLHDGEKDILHLERFLALMNFTLIYYMWCSGWCGNSIQMLVQNAVLNS